MSAPQLHFFFSHVPAITTGFGLLALLYGWLRKSDEVRRISLVLFVLGALAAVPLYVTGEPSADQVRGLPHVSKDLIEQHENTSTVAFVLIIILGVAALFTLYLEWKRLTVPRLLLGGLLVLAALTIGLLAMTSTIGGKISHPELRPGYVAPPGSEEDKDSD
jgi:hypothetical protein